MTVRPIAIVERGKRSPFAPDLFDLIHGPTQNRMVSVYGREESERAAIALGNIPAEILSGPDAAAEITTRLVIAGLWSVGDMRERTWCAKGLRPEQLQSAPRHP